MKKCLDGMICVINMSCHVVSVKVLPTETFEVRFEPVTWTTSNVKVLPTEL